jgi:hypothetical protein
VLGAYHQLWQIEKSFRMSKTDLRARPIYHHIRDSIEAHLTIVMAALAVSHWLERQTGWSIKKLVKTLRRYRTIAVQTGDHILHVGTPLDDDTRRHQRRQGHSRWTLNLSQVRFECDLIRLRTRDGMKVAKAKGRLRGKQPTLKPNQTKHLLESHD